MFGQKRYITATHIRQIPPERTADEVFYHIAETAMTALIFERGPVSVHLCYFTHRFSSLCSLPDQVKAQCHTARARSKARALRRLPTPHKHTILLRTRINMRIYLHSNGRLSPSCARNLQTRKVSMSLQ